MTLSAIEHFGRPTPHKARTDGGYDAAGFAQPDGFAAPVTITAVCQPVGTEDLQDMPEGIRVAARWKVWTRAAIREDDLLTIDGEDHRILHVSHWLGHHREAVAGKT